MKTVKTLALLFFSVLVITSCEKDDPEVPHPEELITTLIYELVSQEGDTIKFTFRDLDGDGGEEPVITGGSVLQNTTYAGTITLLNETEEPAEDITEEIREEAQAHQFFFQLSDNFDATVAYTDMDEDVKPIGLTTSFVTGNIPEGELTITLRHEPAKFASGVSEGDITNAGGETDIEVTFDVDTRVIL